MPVSGNAPQVKNAPKVEECFDLIDRIAVSNQLRRASRLQELLQYLGKRALQDHCGSVHEQTVGVDVFGRPGGYDTSTDNIVRTNVSELRKRIDAYFASEGSDETIVMEIPRWNYVPIFRHRPPVLPDPILPQAPSEIPIRATVEDLPVVLAAARTHRLTIIALAAAASLLAIACVSLWIQNRSMHRLFYAWQYEPTVSQLWSEIFAASPDTDVVLADASFGLLQDLNKRTFSLDSYLDHSYINDLQIQNPSLSRIVRWNLGSQDEFKLAHRILALDPLGHRMHLYGARDYMPDLTNRDNVILIGGRISNPWDELFERHMNFPVRFDTDGSITVVNRAPAAGEQAVYTQSGSTQYCVIAYLPNPGHHSAIIMVEGTGAEATEAAGNFLLSEDQLSSFKKMLHVDRLPYFEALLKVSSVEGTPLAASVEAYRAYPVQHPQDNVK